LTGSARYIKQWHTGLNLNIKRGIRQFPLIITAAISHFTVFAIVGKVTPEPTPTPELTPEPTPTPESDEEAKDGFNWPLFWWIATGLIVIAGASYFLIKRRKK